MCIIAHVIFRLPPWSWEEKKNTTQWNAKWSLVFPLSRLQRRQQTKTSSLSLSIGVYTSSSSGSSRCKNMISELIRRNDSAIAKYRQFQMPDLQVSRYYSMIILFALRSTRNTQPSPPVAGAPESTEPTCCPCQSHIAQCSISQVSSTNMCACARCTLYISWLVVYFFFLLLFYRCHSGICSANGFNLLSKFCTAKPQTRCNDLYYYSKL